MTASGEIADLLEVEVPVGGRVVVAADLHLTREPSAAQLAATGELAEAIDGCSGPGVIVLAGNLLDNPADGRADDPAAVLTAHSRLTAALGAFAGAPGRRVIVLPGDRDVRIASTPSVAAAVRKTLGADIALAVDLSINTGAGRRKVRVEPGYRLDPLTEYRDPRNPLESPYAAHLRGQVLPALRRRAAASSPDDRPDRFQGLRRERAERRRTRQAERAERGATWLAGAEDLADVGGLSRFVASRLVYRRLIHSGWLLLVPVIAALVLRLPTTVVRSARAGALTTRVGLFVSATILELLILLLIGIAAIRVTNRALGAVALDDDSDDPNDAARTRARQLVTDGYSGYVTGHTCRPELVPLGTGFYANAGAGAEVVSEYPTRLPGVGLPNVFLPHRILSWVEVEAGNEMHVRLQHARQDLVGSSLIERLVASRSVTSSPGELRPQLVASFPNGSAWPPPPPLGQRDRRVRRLAALLLVLVGFVSLVSAMSDPFHDRLDVLRGLFPLAVPETASAITAFFGVALIVLARGVRRGQRRAWAVCQFLLLAVALLHLVKGVDIEETLVALAAAAVLYVFRDSFRARTDVAALRRGLLSVVGAFGLTVIAGTLAVEISTAINHTRHHRNPRVSWGHAVQAVLYRMVGSHSVHIPPRIDQFLAPAMLTSAIGLLLALLAVLFRPVVTRSRLAAARQEPLVAGTAKTPASPSSHNGVAPVTGAGDGSVVSGPEGLVRARAVLQRHGSGTLDYFALRPDKDFFFWADTVVAHAIYGSVCLVSPDPIGPVAEREEAWRAFRRYVDAHGWALGGLGMGEDWLPVYRATGMHELYVGDEAVVRVGRFSLEGGRFKGLRQAVNRVAKYGYRITFHDPARMDPPTRDRLREVMTQSRRGDVERGFSMTLGRIFDSYDEGLLLAVVHGPAGEGELGPPVAFCQYVPAPGIDGFSLDLMRRDDGEHPNGLIDFAVVETIRELERRGMSGLGLNFATMRAVLAGEAGEGVVQRTQAWVLRRMGDSMQIESLWRFNAKFDPDWQPRYAMYDAPENALAVAIAIARAESFWELPVIGRFLVPSGS